MTAYVPVGPLKVAADLHAFVRDEALPGTGLDEAAFWAGAAGVIADLAPRIADALAERTRLQQAIDDYHRAHVGPVDPVAYEAVLTDLGYLRPEPVGVRITTTDTDPEVATQPGPQLVVPVMNARFATNAANARWGSLYDALYGTDVVDEAEGRARGTGYNPMRGAAVIARARAFLDEAFPLADGSHADARGYRVEDGALVIDTETGPTTLADGAAFAGYLGDPQAPDRILLAHHGLHAQVVVDRSHPIGATDPANVADVVLESALTAIMDLEDSVAAVDSADKVLGYRNWLGLVQRTLTADVVKAGTRFERHMNEDLQFTAPDGGTVTVRGTALLFVRHVGHLMTTDAILDEAGRPVPEGLVDALIAGLCSVHDIRGPFAGRNSQTGSIYVVKPKLHGPDEVALACETFDRVEQVLALAPNTIKIGIMDEERRTTVNLAACIDVARDRVAFINTGFLDRTGDEIRTSTYAGPMVRKADMKASGWISAYEDRNVDLGLAAEFPGRAQIGKGMWAAPDNLADMVEQKIAHPLAGATCAWVPSPTAATLHALHYHRVDVAERQRAIAAGGPRATREQLLQIPLGDPSAWSAEDVAAELDNNVQSTLGYVVRWVDAGVGCSKVPDITGTPLMEDRATCRISSQLVSNWLLHGVVGLEEVEESLRRMAVVVDGQNAADPGYEPMAPAFDGPAFLAARELLIHGVDQPSGYTEPVLHAHRIAKKEQSA